jgi:hypothetical protein
MGGLHKRVGELKKQDEPLSIDMLKAAENILELEWARAKNGFCSGLRGEEMVLIERAGTVNSRLVHLADKDPWFKLVISRLTKENQLK